MKLEVGCWGQTKPWKLCILGCLVILRRVYLVDARCIGRISGGMRLGFSGAAVKGGSGFGADNSREGIRVLTLLG